MSKQKTVTRQEAPSSEGLSVLSRRSLLKVGGAAALAGTALASGVASADDDKPTEDDYFKSLKELNARRESCWKEDGKYFVQENVDASSLEDGVIRARIDGEWHDFLVREIDDAFYNFNMTMRMHMLDVMYGMAGLDMYNDAHNAAVGTYGGNRGDSRFTVNVAFKGMGWVPTPDKIAARTKLYADNYQANMMDKVKTLQGGYQDASIWDRRVQASLELYTSRENETHSFLNQIVNPVSTLCFLGIESYEFRTIARLMDPADPGLSPYEKDLTKWINFAHDFFHGGPNPTQLTVHNIAVAYYVIEEFDNSPMGATATAGGMKRVPAG